MAREKSGKEIRRFMVETSFGKKLARPLSQPIAGCGGVHLSSQIHKWNA
jgi:hypothetical protein